MHTPAHTVFNLLVLGRRSQPQLILPITIGSVLPDAPMFLFYFWEKHLMGRTERWIWSIGYHDPFWQAFFDLFNSIPLLGLVALLSLWRGRRRLLAMFGSMILHGFVDLLLHHHDSHRHFFPFSEWRFESPVSYWDPRYYGHIFAPLEFLLVLSGCLVLIMTWKLRAVRLIAGGILLVYALFIAFAISVWGAVF